jgi:hypothetical protein
VVREPQESEAPRQSRAADQLSERIETERRKLQRASAVLLALVYSSDNGLETEQAAGVASVALDLVDSALAGLDIVALKRPGGAS